LYSQDEESEDMSFIMDYNSFRKRDITFIKKINMGIPDGNNWLVEWTDNTSKVDIIRNIIIYVVKEKIILFENRITFNFDTSEYSDFDIMQNIPGVRLGEGSCVVYDYNDDGFDEIFNYGFWGNQWLIHIEGYDPEKEAIVDYADIPFDIIDRKKGPAPIEFTNYKGMKGFKIYFASVEVAGGPGFVPDPHPYNRKWIFYTWDKEQRKFVDIGEYTEETVIEQDQHLFAEDNNVQEKAIFSLANNGKKSNFNLFVGIIASIIVLATIIWYFIVNKRKNG
jgi:hypothetical protein